MREHRKRGHRKTVGCEFEGVGCRGLGWLLWLLWIDVRGVMIIGDFYDVPVYDVRFSLIRC